MSSSNGDILSSRQLRQFMAAYRHLNFTEAAHFLNMTQPALTKSIQEMEARLGVRLFDRLPTGVVPTAFGDVIARHGAAILLEASHASAEIEAMKGGTSGTVRLGAGPIWLTHFLPPVLAAFQEARPNARISIEGHVINTAIAALIKGQIDIFCGSLDFPEHPDLECRPLRLIEHCVIAREGHPIFCADRPSVERLQTYAWAMLDNDHVGRQNLARTFAQHGLAPPRVALESSSIIAILNAVRHGQLLTSLARPLLEHDPLNGLCEVPGIGPIWRHMSGIVMRRNQHQPPLIEQFAGAITKAFPVADGSA